MKTKKNIKFNVVKLLINFVLGLLGGISIIAFHYTSNFFYLIGLVGNIVIFTLYNKKKLNEIKGKIKTSLK